MQFDVPSMRIVILRERVEKKDVCRCFEKMMGVNVLKKRMCVNVLKKRCVYGCSVSM